MKKLLIGLTAIALSFTGLSTPAAQAVGVTPPTISGGSNGNAVIGSTLTATPASNLPNGYSIFTGGWFFCTSAESPVQGSMVTALMNWSQQSPRCDWLATDSLNSRPGSPWTVSSSFYDGYTSTLRTNTLGWELRWIDIISDGSNYATYFSAPLNIASAAQTVTYDANTGTGTIASSVANGARALADGSALSRPGYSFSGWNTAANGTGTAIAGGASYTPSGNVTLYAQWTRIPTPPAPVFTSPIAVAPVGGVLNLSGTNLATVTSITVGNTAATISTSSNGQVVVKLPELAPGKYDLTIKNADGGIRFIDGLVVPDPNAKPAPAPTNTYVAEAAVAVKGSTLTSAQRSAIAAFAKQYKDASEVTCFVSTSKSGLNAARKAAAATCAAAAKAIGKKVRTSVIVDSVSETRTTISVVVKD